MKDPFVELKALAEQKIFSEAQLLQKFKAFEARLSEILEGTNVFGSSKTCKLEYFEPDQELIYGHLYFSNGTLSIAYRSRDEDADDYMLYRVINPYNSFSIKSIDGCKIEWLKSLTKTEVLESLCTSLAENLHKNSDEARIATKSLSATINLPLRNLDAMIVEESEQIGYSAVCEDWCKAQSAIEIEPSDAVTRACRMLETLFKHFLGDNIPSNQTLRPLYTEVRKSLHLNASNQLSKDMNKLLSGLISVVEGIGDMRTHVGTAHGRSKDEIPINVDQARLTVNAAGIVGLYFIGQIKAHKNR